MLNVYARSMDKLPRIFFTYNESITFRGQVFCNKFLSGICGCREQCKAQLDIYVTVGFILYMQPRCHWFQVNFIINPVMDCVKQFNVLVMQKANDHWTSLCSICCLHWSLNGHKFFAISLHHRNKHHFIIKVISIVQVTFKVQEYTLHQNPTVHRTLI